MMISSNAPVRSLTILTIIISLISVMLAIETSAQTPASVAQIYPKSSDYNPPVGGYFASGVALVDINGDQLKDIVASNGNDVVSQQLTVYYNQGSNNNYFNNTPDWISNFTQYMNGLATGDIDKNGWIDVAVAFTNPANGLGGIAVFYNYNGTLELEPSYQTLTNPMEKYATLGCALADVNGDSFLDLIVAVLTEQTVSNLAVHTNTRLSTTPGGRSRIYRNNAGKFSLSPCWVTATNMAATSVIAADINQDGLLDLAFAAERAYVYYGQQPDKSQCMPIANQPGWRSNQIQYFSYAIDAGNATQDQIIPATPTPTTTHVPAQTGLMLTVPSAKVESTTFGLVSTYQPTTSQDAIWQTASGTPAQPSNVLLGDLNNDGYLELLVDQWICSDCPSCQSPKLGGRLFIFQGAQGTNNSVSYPAQPTYASDSQLVGEKIALADLQNRSVKTLINTCTATKAVKIVTLPQRIIDNVISIERDGKTLTTADYSWSPGNNWISLVNPLAANESIKVTYQASIVRDIVVVNWNAIKGNNIFFSTLTQ